MELNNTTSLFEIFTGFNLLYSLTKKETFADVLNERIVKPYDKSIDYVQTINGEIDFYSQSTIQLLEIVETSNSLDLIKKNEFKKELYELDNLIDALKKELRKSFQSTLSKIDIAKKESVQLLDKDFSYLSLYFAFFSIQVLYIIPTTNSHRILSILFLDVISLLILASIIFREKIERFSFKQNFFGLFSIELNIIVNIFLFRISTWRNFSHMNIILLFISVTVACFLFHLFLLKNIHTFNSEKIYIMDIKFFLHKYKDELETFIIILSTLIPISHFIYISIVSILKSIKYQLVIWYQSYSKGSDSVRIIRHTYNRISEHYKLHTQNTI